MPEPISLIDQKTLAVPVHAVLRKLDEAKKAKALHKESADCGEQYGAGCTACHFYSGAISSLSELLGEPGVIA